MGRDKVLGLSLAILLIGFAGAFCFRNEPFVENGLKLARAKILDERIAQRPGPKPYVADNKSEPAPSARPTVTLEGIQAIEPEPPRTAQRSKLDTSTARSSEPTSPIDTGNSQKPPLDQFVSSQKERQTPEPTDKATGPTASSAAILDKPLELTIRPNSPAFAPPDSLLEDSMTWQHHPDGRDGCPAMTGRETERSEPSIRPAPKDSGDSRTYCVRRGDTLTKIAQHFLGDSNRYREIFAANRDQLETPNARLKVGMTLQIPADRPRSKRPGNSAVGQSKSTRANNSLGESPRARQVPARPVSRTRELSNSHPGEKTPSTTPSADEPQEPMGKLRFVPVSKGPFLRSRGESSSANPHSTNPYSANPHGRDLSQRAPAAQGQDGVPDGDVNRKRDGNSSGEVRTKSSPNPEGESSTMSSDGSEGT